MQLIKCSDPDLCPYGSIENSTLAFKEITGQPMHILWVVLIILIIPILNSCALNVTKYGSAAQRSTIECARIPVVWVYFMLVPVYGVKVESFTFLQLFGFLILFVGVMIYNEMITIPFYGFNKYTKKAISMREERSIKEERKSLSLHTA